MNNLPKLGDDSVYIDWIPVPEAGEFGFEIRTFPKVENATPTTVCRFSSASFRGIPGQVLSAIKAAQQMGYNQAQADMRRAMGIT